MTKKILIGMLMGVLAVDTARAADRDDWLFLLGGLIVGNAIAQHDNERREEHRPAPPPYRQPRLVPIYETVCHFEGRYDVWGRPVEPVRICRREITGYREVYD